MTLNPLRSTYACGYKRIGGVGSEKHTGPTLFRASQSGVGRGQNYARCLSRPTAIENTVIHELLTEPDNPLWWLPC